MRVEQQHIPDRWLFDSEPLECTSVGILIHTEPLERSCSPSFVFVEQMDQPDKPWGIPAGRTEDYEKDPTETAVREVEEEVGLSIEASQLSEFVIFKSEGKAKIVYSCLAGNILGLSQDWQSQDGILVTSRNRHEIGRIALVPRFELFRRSHPIISSYYRWDLIHYVKARLESLRII